MKSATVVARASGVLALSLALTACVKPPEAPPAPIRDAPPVALPERCRPPPLETGSRLLTFDRETSYLHIYAYRGGRLARMGHNHVISTRSLWGYLRKTEPLHRSGFILCIPVDSLIVDDPGLRRQVGEPFAGELDESAIAGTRRNMLSEQLLDAGHHPYLVVEGRAHSQSGNRFTVGLTITLRNHAHELTTESNIVSADGSVTASGAISLRQSALGLEPFSILFGALQVQDRLDIRYSLTARSPP